MAWTGVCKCLLISILVLPTVAKACSVWHIDSGVELVAHADSVVRVRAVDYETEPSNPGVRTTGVPDSIVNFQIIETVRGKTPQKLALHGYFTQQDDFNDQTAPYTSVRPGGRAGSCFANSYRQGAEYLLFLKRADVPGEWTVNWSALAPVNEQLHAAEDPWLIWVRAQAVRLQ